MGKVKSIMESIITADMEHCFICRKTPVEIHHIVFGTANRDLSDKFGLVVPLCEKHHRTGQHAVHQYRAADLYFKKLAQERFAEFYPHHNFQQIFGKDWNE